jgi:hypothetical protein
MAMAALQTAAIAVSRRCLNKHMILLPHHENGFRLRLPSDGNSVLDSSMPSMRSGALNARGERSGQSSV